LEGIACRFPAASEAASELSSAAAALDLAGAGAALQKLSAALAEAGVPPAAPPVP